MTAAPTNRTTGLLLLSFALVVNLPYTLLQMNFDYPNILRRPAAEVLLRFHDGGLGLILTWFGFGLCALLFLPAAVLLPRLLAGGKSPWTGVAVSLGVASALLQAIGLMRWALVIPAVAEAYADPAAGEATRAAAIMVYRAVHQYGGVVLGEQMGQLLLAGWSGLVALAMLRSTLMPRFVGWLGLATVPPWLAAQVELLSTVAPGLPKLALGGPAFMLWVVWILATGVVLVLPRRAAPVAAGA